MDNSSGVFCRGYDGLGTHAEAVVVVGRRVWGAVAGGRVWGLLAVFSFAVWELRGRARAFCHFLQQREVAMQRRISSDEVGARECGPESPVQILDV